MGGMLANSKIYKSYIKTIDYQSFSGGFSDELDHRKLLTKSKKVAIADAHYYFRQQPNSIVHNSSKSSFSKLKNNYDIWIFTKSEFGDDKKLLQKEQEEYLNTVYRCQVSYYTNIFKPKEQIEIEELIKESYHKIKQERMSFNSIKLQLLASSFHLFKIISRTAALPSMYKSK